MSRFTGTDAANLKEAYASIYAYKPQWVINEETGGAVLVLDEETGDYITEEYLNEQADLFIDKLIEEEFDFSKTTLDELSQKFIDYSLNEGWAQNLGANIRGGINRAASGVRDAVGGAVNRAKDRIGAAAQGLTGQRTTSRDPLARAGNFVTRAATAVPRAAGDFARGLVTGKPGKSGGENLGTDIKRAFSGAKNAGKAAAGAGKAAAAGAAGAAAGAVGKAGGRAGQIAGQKEKAAPKAEPQKKMGSIERRNREIHGDKKIDALKQKNKDFQAAKKQKGGMDAFAKKYPNSNTARERNLRNRIPTALDLESYDFESREGQIALNVINVIADSMIHQGKKAYDVIEYLNTASVESITEMYLNHDEKVITESIIKEEFIDAQYEELNELWAGLARVGAKVWKPLVRGAKALVGKGAGTAKQLTLPGTSRLALATSGVKNSVKNAVKPLAGLWSKVPGSVKGGLVGGGTVAALTGGKKGDTYNVYNYGSSAGSAKSDAKDAGKEAAKELDKAGKDEKKKADGYVQNYNKATSSVSVSQQGPGAKRHPVSGNRPPKGAVSGSGTEKDPWKSKVTKTYVKSSYDLEPFDIVMEHLLSTEQAANVDEALYIMSEMDSDAIQAIIDKK